MGQPLWKCSEVAGNLWQICYRVTILATLLNNLLEGVGYWQSSENSLQGIDNFCKSLTYERQLSVSSNHLLEGFDYPLKHFAEGTGYPQETSAKGLPYLPTEGKPFYNTSEDTK